MADRLVGMAAHIGVVVLDCGCRRFRSEDRMAFSFLPIKVPVFDGDGCRHDGIVFIQWCIIILEFTFCFRAR